MVEDKLAKGRNADEFVLIGEADDFKIYITAGKTIKRSHVERLHQNPRDIFMLILEGEAEFTFENGEKQTVKAGECFVLHKHLRHSCVFKKTTIAIEGIYEKDI
jgi:quercetin dioxygenase-like cupin family protein